MDRRFANTTTPDDPDFANLQRAFWNLAIERFGRIKAHAGQDGPSDQRRNPIGQPAT